MECPHCKFVAAPGQAAVEGICPSCERPYRDQPSPTNSDMEMRNMPAPGMEDSGGNPLQEGILGDYQNRGVRDQSFASTEHKEDEEEPEFEVVEVVPPDPDSIRPDKKQMDKQADFLDDVGNTISDVAPVAAPIAGGTAGFLVGGPAGAAIGAGLAGGGVEALQGGDVGDIAGTGLTDAALGGLGGGLGTLGKGALAAGTAEEAAGAGATRGGIGSLMKSAWGKVPTEKIKNAYLMHSALNDAGGASQQVMQPAAPIAPPAPVQQPSYYSSDTGSSSDHIPSNDPTDPEQVDFHEKSDETSGDPLSQIDVNNIGGSDTGPDGLFAPDSDALGSLAELLPKVLEYALSDQSAAGDSDMENLHSLLEREHPGYMNDADDSHGEKLVMAIIGGPKGESDDQLLQDNDEPHDPLSEHEASALKPGLESTCPRCGGVVDASVAACPQCGMNNMGHQPQPTNPDFTDPSQMAVPTPPQLVTAASAEGMEGQGPNTKEQQAVVAQLLMESGRGEEIPNMLLNPHEYAEELAEITGGEAPPEDLGQPGPPPLIDPSQQQGEMPVPGMAPPGEGAMPTMARAIAKYAGTVDGICEPCPKCKSHSTGYTDYEEGNAGCKTCGHNWKTDPLVEHTTSMVHEAEIHDDYEEEPTEGSNTWVDAEGQPLKNSQSYDMYSGNYDIPDRVKITAVKPDAIEYLMVGEYGLNHQTQLTHEEASMEKLTFVPVDPADELEPETEPEVNNMEDVARPAPGEQTDQSTPHVLMSSTEKEWTTHNAALEEVTNPDAVQEFFEKQDAPTSEPVGHQSSMESEETGPAWLVEGVPLERTAGAHMTPYEQRGFIEEDGVARNSDKLSLNGTHYEMDELDDSFLFGL